MSTGGLTHRALLLAALALGACAAPTSEEDAAAASAAASENAPRARAELTKLLEHPSELLSSYPALASVGRGARTWHLIPWVVTETDPLEMPAASWMLATSDDVLLLFGPDGVAGAGTDDSAVTRAAGDLAAMLGQPADGNVVMQGSPIATLATKLATAALRLAREEAQATSVKVAQEAATAVSQTAGREATASAAANVATQPVARLGATAKVVSSRAKVDISVDPADFGLTPERLAAVAAKTGGTVATGAEATRRLMRSSGRKVFFDSDQARRAWVSRRGGGGQETLVSWSEPAGERFAGHRNLHLQEPAYDMLGSLGAADDVAFVRNGAETLATYCDEFVVAASRDLAIDLAGSLGAVATLVQARMGRIPRITIMRLGHGDDAIEAAVREWIDAANHGWANGTRLTRAALDVRVID